MVCNVFCWNPVSTGSEIPYNFDAKHFDFILIQLLSNASFMPIPFLVLNLLKVFNMIY